MINAVALLLGFQLLGEVLVRFTHAPVPGPVVGGVALAVLLLLRGGPGANLSATAHTILRNLSLLFVPAAVGVIEYRRLFMEHGIALGAALVVSTALALMAAALAFRLASR